MSKKFDFIEAKAPGAAAATTGGGGAAKAK
jgi:hypothetical protein